MLPHLIGFLLAIGASGVSCILGGVALRGYDRWFAGWLLAAGPLTLILLIAFLVTFDRSLPPRTKASPG